MKRVALIAHDNKKKQLVEWVKEHQNWFLGIELVATGTTGALIEAETGLKVEKCKSGPLGGDLQIGSQLSEGKVDGLVFLWDPLSPHSHDVDVKALLRVAVLYNIPLACNLATAESLIQDWLRS
jgi:methylglyoxal synthase